MPKAILVMDMPENCHDCIASNLVMCRAAHEFVPKKGIGKPDWCPLRELPEKMEVCGKYPQPCEPVPSYRCGWNACLDEILK